MLSLTDYCHSGTFDLTTENPIDLQSPLHASNYPSNLHCTWLVTTNIPGYLHVVFVSFIGVETNVDYLDIGYGGNVSLATSRVLHLSGISAPKWVTIEGDAMWALFYSNNKYGWYGFDMTIEWRESKGMYGKTANLHSSA